MRRISQVFTAAAVILFSHTAYAQTAPAMSPETRHLLNRLTRAGPTLQGYLQQAQAEFVQADADSDGRVSSADDDIHAAMAEAQFRMGATMLMMRFDLDSDGVITAEEMSRLQKYEQRVVDRGRATQFSTKMNEQAATDFRAADVDGDGRVTFAEMLALLKTRPMPILPGNISTQHTRPVMMFDTNGDGTVTREEFDAAHEAFFRTADTDGNGIVSAEELAAHRVRLGEPATDPRHTSAQNREAAQLAERKQREQAAVAERKRKEDEARAACAMPKPSAAAKVVLLGTHRTDAFSDVTLGSQDTATYAGTVAIEAGAEPLYVVISSLSAVVWRFTGAVERIEHVVLASSQGAGETAAKFPSVGATGVPAARLSFMHGRNCLGYFSDVPSIESAKAAGQVAREIGKAPDMIAGITEVSGFTVSKDNVRIKGDPGKPKVMIFQKSAGTLTVEGDSALVVKTPGRRNLNKELRRFVPGGVVRFDPRTVVSKAQVESYVVLPQLAGLLQLEKSGALTQNRRGEFLIHKKIRLPPGVGSYSADFLLLKDVPVPDGEVKRAGIISQETGKEIGAEP